MGLLDRLLRPRESAGNHRSHLAAACAVSVASTLTYFAYGRGYVSLDPMFSLVWGRELATGQVPDFSYGPTPHPLSNTVGAALSTLGADAEHALLALSYLSLGVLAYATWLIAIRVGGPVVAIVAVGLLLTRRVIADATALAQLDIPFAALVMIAIALELKRPRCGWPVLAILAIAGLLRPEAWFMAGIYWLWLLPGLSWSEAVRLALLVIVAPVVWTAADLLITGDALFSLHSTTTAAEQVTPGSGPGAVVREGPRTIGRAARPEVAIGSLLGLALLLRLRSRNGIAIAGVIVVVTVATFAPAVAGTLVNPRYTIPLVALLCVLAGVAVGGWRTEGQTVWKVAACVSALVLAVTLPGQVDILRDQRQRTVVTAASRRAVRDLVSGQLPCTPLIVPNVRLVPFVAFWRDIERREIVDASRPHRLRGTYVFGTPAALNGIVVAPDRDRGKILPRPPRSARPVRSEGGWTLYAAC